MVVSDCDGNVTEGDLRPSLSQLSGDPLNGLHPLAKRCHFRPGGDRLALPWHHGLRLFPRSCSRDTSNKLRGKYFFRKHEPTAYYGQL